MSDWTETLIKPRVFWPLLAALGLLIGGYTVWSYLPAASGGWGDPRLLARETSSGRVQGQGFSVPLPAGYLWLDKVGDSVVGRRVADVKAKGGILLMEDAAAGGAELGNVFVWWSPKILATFAGALADDAACAEVAEKNNNPPKMTITSAGLKTIGSRPTCRWVSRRGQQRSIAAVLSVGGVRLLVVCNHDHGSRLGADACDAVLTGIQATPPGRGAARPPGGGGRVTGGYHRLRLADLQSRGEQWSRPSIRGQSPSR